MMVIMIIMHINIVLKIITLTPLLYCRIRIERFGKVLSPRQHLGVFNAEPPRQSDQGVWYQRELGHPFTGHIGAPGVITLKRTEIIVSKDQIMRKRQNEEFPESPKSSCDDI